MDLERSTWGAIALICTFVFSFISGWFFGRQFTSRLPEKLERNVLYIQFGYVSGRFWRRSVLDEFVLPKDHQTRAMRAKITFDPNISTYLHAMQRLTGADSLERTVVDSFGSLAMIASLHAKGYSFGFHDGSRWIALPLFDHVAESRTSSVEASTQEDI